MVNEEILGGLRNALDRGYSFEMAVQSFINAGYNPNDVREAAEHLSSGALPLVHPESRPAQPAPPPRTAPPISSMASPAQAPTPAQPSPSQMPKPYPSQMQRPYPAQPANQSFISFLGGDQGRFILIGGIVLSLFILFGALGYILVRFAL